MNADASRNKSSTPPSGPRTTYDIALHYARKSKEKYDEAKAINEAFYLRARSGEFGGSRTLADIAASQDDEWRRVVADQQFYERLGNHYAALTNMNLLGQLLVEQRRTNDLLDKIAQKLS